MKLELLYLGLAGAAGGFVSTFVNGKPTIWEMLIIVFCGFLGSIFLAPMFADLVGVSEKIDYHYGIGFFIGSCTMAVVKVFVLEAPKAIKRLLKRIK